MAELYCRPDYCRQLVAGGQARRRKEQMTDETKPPETPETLPVAEEYPHG